MKWITKWGYNNVSEGRSHDSFDTQIRHDE